ncbi:hypothetical protein HMPREF9519_01828 [Enterococcus faecalis TX1346]|nr:hypothetical protein HMPREF9519_01828 [Enterococcus faecalis TX1346]
MPRMQQRWKSSSSGNCDQRKGVKTMQSPTALNKRGNKVTIDGYIFDSEKEAKFYQRFVKNCGLPFEVHPRFTMHEKCEIPGGNISSIAYSPDFIIKDHDGNWLHVIDIKNSFGAYGIDQSNKLRFRLFAMKYGHPVEAVVIRSNDFKVITQGVTKPLNEKKPFITNNFNYHWRQATNY